MRRTESFNDRWYFVRKASDAADAVRQAVEQQEAVTLPHTWNALDGQDGGNDYYRGTCWYVKHFSRPDMPKRGRAFLKFEGVAMTAHVYVNGRECASHEGGYSTFYADITDALTDDNTIAVSVDNSANDRVYPQMADFTNYGGIYRPVSLVITEAYHFSFRDGAEGVRVTPYVTLTEGYPLEDDPSINSGNPTKAANPTEARNLTESHVHTESDNHTEVICEARVDGADGSACVSFSISGTDYRQIVPVQDGCVKCTFSLENAHLWDGLNDPYLYTLQADLISPDQQGQSASVEETTVIDSVSVRFGCRKTEVDPQRGFLLNGRPYPLRGISRHQDREGVGNALTSAMHEEDIALIREIGANSVRLAHYQHAQYFLDLCDTYGILVWEEIPLISMFMNHGRENTLLQMRELVLQCSNHPSIYCWGLSNEITAAGSVTEEMLANHRDLQALCHRLDPSRPTTLASVYTLKPDSPLLQIPDISTYNLYYGWYQGKLEDNATFLDSYHSQYPDRAIGLSEYGADANLTYQTSSPRVGDYTEQYQCLYHEYILKMLDQRPWIFASYVWNMFDFGSDGRNEGGRAGVNQKGLVSFDRKTKKDAFYLYKAAWNHRDAFVHLCGSRYIHRCESETEIRVYSNQREVSLYVNGEPAGTKQGENVFVFHVQLPETGTYDVVAKAGDVASDIMQIERVCEPDKSYVYDRKQVKNWFDPEGTNPEYFSVNDTYGEIMENPEAAAVLQRLMAAGVDSMGGGAAASANRNPAVQKMLSKMTIANIFERGGLQGTKEINQALQKIRK